MLTVGPREKKTKIERNKQTNANRDPEKWNPHFSLTMEVKREDEACLQRLHCQLDHAKSLLGINRKSSLMQNADLLERLLNCFELVMPSAVNLGPSPAASTSSVQLPPKKLPGTRTRTQQPARRPQEADLRTCFCRWPFLCLHWWIAKVTGEVLHKKFAVWILWRGLSVVWIVVVQGRPCVPFGAPLCLQRFTGLA